MDVKFTILRAIKDVQRFAEQQGDTELFVSCTRAIQVVSSELDATPTAYDSVSAIATHPRRRFAAKGRASGDVALVLKYPCPSIGPTQ